MTVNPAIGTEHMMDLEKGLTKARAVLRRGIPSLRNMILARLGVWPVRNLRDHWIADMPVLCISLERATDRRRLISAQVESMGLRAFRFIDAVDARSLTYPQLADAGLYDSRRAIRFHGRDLSLNEIACSLSHAAAYRSIIEAGHQKALIVEDDALFRGARIARLTLESISDDTDIVFLNAFLDTTPPRDRVGAGLFRDTSYAGSAAAYLLTADAARRLLAEAIPVAHAADGLTGRVLELREGQEHTFRQQGVSLSLRGLLVYPEAVTNGSVEHYHISSIR